MKTRPQFQPGALWIGGEDNYVVEILGNGHKPGLKRVRVFEPDGRSSSQMEFVGNRIAQRHVWAGGLERELREVLQSGPTDYRERIRSIRARCEE